MNGGELLSVNCVERAEKVQFPIIIRRRIAQDCNLNVHQLIREPTNEKSVTQKRGYATLQTRQPDEIHCVGLAPWSVRSVLPWAGSVVFPRCSRASRNAFNSAAALPPKPGT